MYWTLSFLFNVKLKRRRITIYLALMLDSKFKSMCFVSIYVGHENATIIVVAYDELVLLPLLM
jgi:hypothetical protein